jgi:glycerophosphoryl diester phosphodiesterase
MIIISHRGYWKEATEKNLTIAFERSFSLGYGTETDIRDFNGKLVISHDIAGEDSLSLDDFFLIYKKHQIGDTAPLALNIKADGLQNDIIKYLLRYDIENYFLFDMSIPDLRVTIEKGLNAYIRLSEYESDTPFYDKIKGIWLDSFINTWYKAEDLLKHINNGKKICIVSADLHKRDYLEHWNVLKEFGIHKMNDVILCTDFPEIATNYFEL